MAGAVDPAQLEEILSILRQSDVPDPAVQQMVHAVSIRQAARKKGES